VILDGERLQGFEPFKEHLSLGPAVRLHVANDYIGAGCHPTLRRFEHGVGLADPCHIAEEDLEIAPA